jgi:hypothetical protein
MAIYKKAKIIMITIGLLVILTIFTTAVIGATNKKDTQKDAASMAYILGSSQTAMTDEYTVTINKVTKNDSKDYAFGYDNEKDTMLIVDVTIRNRTSLPQTLAPSVQFYLRTSDGLTFAMHPSMFVSNPLQFEQVASGTTASGQISFVIPKTITRPLLYVDLGWNNRVPVVYDILH